MTVRHIIGFETGDTSEIVSFGAGCSVVAPPGSGNAGAFAYRNAATSGTETVLAAVNMTRLRCSFRFYVGANPSGNTYYQIITRTSGGAKIAELLLMYDAALPGWSFSLWDITDDDPNHAENQVTPGSNPILGWVTLEIDSQIGATTTVHSAWYTRDADGIRYKIGATGNGTDVTAPSTVNLGTENIWTVHVCWNAVSTGNEPFYIDDFVADDAALPGDARVISRQFVSTTPLANAWSKSTGSTIDTVWNDTPFNAASYARDYLSNSQQLARISPFSATQTGHGSGVIDASDVILGWAFGSVGKAASSVGSGITEIGASQSGSATTGANVTLTFSVAPAAGDVVIVWGGFGTAGAANPGISTAGYTNIVLDTATAARRFGVWSKVMGFTPDTNVVCLGSGTAGDGVAYGSIVLRGIYNNPTPLDIAAVIATGTGTAPNPPASGATVTANALLLSFGASAVNDASKGTQTGGVTYTQLASPTANATRPYSTTASKAVIAAAATNTDPPVWASWTAASWVAATIVVRPTQHAGNNLYRTVYWTGGTNYQYIFSAIDIIDTYTSRLGYEGFGTPGINPTPTLAELDGSEWGFLRDSVAVLHTIADVWAMVAYRPVSGATYNDTTAETAAAADAQSSTAIKPVATAETAAASDASSATAVSVATTAETAAATDAPNSTAIKPVGTAETAAVADAQNSTAIKPVAVAETNAIADAQTSSLAGAASAVAETASASDAQSAAQVNAVTTAETAVTADAQAALWIGSRLVAETAAAADAPVATLARVGAVAETAAAADAQSAAQIQRPAVAETAAVADVQSSLWVSAPILVAETAAVVDASTGDIGAVTTFNVSVAETAAATDAQSTPAKTFSVATAETAAIADASAATMVRAGAVAESAVAADAPASLWIGARAVAETAAVADAQNSTAIKPVATAETAAVADAQNSTAIKPVATAESATITDAADGTVTAGVQTYNKAVAEDAAAADTSSATTVRLGAVAETAAIADTSTGLSAILKAVTESAIVLDASSATQVHVASVAETAAANDTTAATGPWRVAVAESITATDAASYVYLPLQPPRESAIRARSINRAPLDLREPDVPSRRGTELPDRRDANLG